MTAFNTNPFTSNKNKNAWFAFASLGLFQNINYIGTFRIGRYNKNHISLGQIIQMVYSVISFYRLRKFNMIAWCAAAQLVHQHFGLSACGTKESGFEPQFDSVLH